MDYLTERFINSIELFVTYWTKERIQNMSLEEYADLKNPKSFCRQLEYDTDILGKIGGNTYLSKYDIWKPTSEKEFKSSLYKQDGEYAWNRKRGNELHEAFDEIKTKILEIIDFSIHQRWDAIDSVHFHSIVKWKIAFVYSSQNLIPIYSKPHLLRISKGLGGTFNDKDTIWDLQKFILSKRSNNQPINLFAYGLYDKYALPPNYYIIGSKYGDDDGNVTISKIDDFLREGCVAVHYCAHVDFSSYMRTSKDKIYEFVEKGTAQTNLNKGKISGLFNLFSQIKVGDIIAVKSGGRFNDLRILAYAQVVERNGSVYEYDPIHLGHKIYVEFLDYGFEKRFELNYASTLHKLYPNDEKGHFMQVFGWYHNDVDLESLNESFHYNELNLVDDLDEIKGVYYNEKLDITYQRQSYSTSVTLGHNRIQNKFIQYLVANFPNDTIKGEKMFIDALRITNLEEFIYEIKPYQSAFACIRSGIGQLLDYSFKLKTSKKIHLVIIGPNKPEHNDQKFIDYIRNTMRFSFQYGSFDQEKLEVNYY